MVCVIELKQIYLFCFPGPQSVHKTAQYERLAQDPNDNEEEDDVLFNQGGVTAKQNGFSSPDPSKLRKQTETIEMNNLHNNSPSKQNNSNANPDEVSADEINLVKVRVLGKRRMLSRTRIACCVLSLLLCLGLTFMLTLIWPYVSHKGHRNKVIHKTSSWTKTIQNYGKCY